MAAGALFFSLMSLLVKVAAERLPSQEIVLVRAAITLALTWMALQRSGTSPWGNNRPVLAARGLLGFGALSAFYYAYATLPLADATVIQYTSPVFAALIALNVLREQVSGREAVAMAGSLIGVAVVARPIFLFAGQDVPLDPVAVGITLAGAVCSGGAYVLVRKLRTTERPMVIVFYFALVSVVGSLPIALPVAVWPTAFEWLVLLGVGLTTQLGQVCITRGLHLETAGRATAVGYLQVVLAAVWGTLFFAEHPDLATMIGAVLILASTLSLARRPGEST